MHIYIYIYIVTLLLLTINVVCGYASIRVGHAGLDMSVGIYGNELLTVISALAGIGAVILICIRFSNSFLRYLGRNTMVYFAWHSRIIIVGCGIMYSALGLFQSDTIASQLGYTFVTLILILAILTPVTEGLKNTRAAKYFGLK